jgi:general secretion pathway protein C
VITPPSGAQSGKEYGKGVRKVGANAYEIPQNELNEAFENLSEISTQARMVPAFEDGKPIGFRVFSVRPNSVFSKIGLENGDIIMRVNGYDLNSPEKVLEMYPKLKTGQEFSIDMKRGGSPMTLTYSVKP